VQFESRVSFHNDWFLKEQNPEFTLQFKPFSLPNCYVMAFDNNFINRGMLLVKMI